MPKWIGLVLLAVACGVVASLLFRRTRTPRADHGPTRGPATVIWSTRPKPGEPHPPGYLAGKAVRPEEGSAGRRLLDRRLIGGHGVPIAWVFDIRTGARRTFKVQLPDRTGQDLCPVTVRADAPDGSGSFLIYDTRRHPASIYSLEPHSRLTPKHQPHFRCPKCGHDEFEIAVGFEVPEDAESPNDVSWFFLFVRCNGCSWEDVIYEDETA